MVQEAQSLEDALPDFLDLLDYAILHSTVPAFENAFLAAQVHRICIALL